jgi:hypothetical protein
MINATQEMRTSYRKPVHGQGQLFDAVTDRVNAIDLLDISVGGISFLSTPPLQKDSIWIVRFDLNGEKVRGVIRITYCVKHSLAEAHRVGAEFRNWEAAYLLSIRNFVG